MASVILSGSASLSIPLHSLSPRRYCSRNQALALNPSQFLSPSSVLKLKRQIALPILRFGKLRNPKPPQAVPTIFSLQSNFIRAVQAVWKVGKDGIEAGTNLVPNFIPRPIARISVTVLALTLGLYLLKSFISTAFFVLAMMGLIYFTFIALNKNEGLKGDDAGTGTGSGSTSVEDSLEEARRIMDKYK